MRLPHQIAAGRGRIEIASPPEHSIRPTMKRILHLLAVMALLPALSSLLLAQADSGAFIVRHGRDTVAIEHFARTRTNLQGTLMLRNPKRTSERYSAVIAPDGTLPMIQVTVSEGVDTGKIRPKIVQRGRVIFKQDSAAVDEVGDAGLMTRVFGTEEGAIPYLNLSFALLEQAVRRARATPGRSQVAFFNLGGGQTLSAKLSPLGRDSLKLDIGDIRYHLRVDEAGRILGAWIPVQDVVVERR
jgi:hypothetical protein